MDILFSISSCILLLISCFLSALVSCCGYLVFYQLLYLAVDILFSISSCILLWIFCFLSALVSCCGYLVFYQLLYLAVDILYLACIGCFVFILILAEYLFCFRGRITIVLVLSLSALLDHLIRLKNCDSLSCGLLFYQ